LSVVDDGVIIEEEGMFVFDGTRVSAKEEEEETGLSVDDKDEREGIIC
jgi:hypothetical protein